MAITSCFKVGCHYLSNFKNCYNKNDMALCKKFDEIYEYGKLLREKGGALARQIYQRCCENR
ncbi:hypothetical protein [Campylobacter concisus]|uniref:hypothetical protein n=1 Tax=Campylobacter concisus TaxID=199 RepID=UPI000CD9C460|nr:hypothetical protein [Campylobacter concisus]